MFFADLLSCIVALFLGYFILYNLVIVFYSSRGRLFDVSKKDYMTKYQQNLTVIIYSHNNSEKVKELIDTLNRQEYDADKYKINVLLDNCNDENIKLLEILGTAKLWRLNSDVKPVGKYKALSWLFERIMACENTNAFVFISADHKIKPDFLQKVNTAAYYNPVVVGEVLKKRTELYNRILNFKNKLANKVFKHGRFYASLGNIIQSEVLVICQEVLEKVPFKKTDKGFEEYEYSIALQRYDIPVLYSQDVAVTKTSVETLKTLAIKAYEKRYKSFITFQNNFKFLLTGNLSVKELVLSLVYPSNTVFVLCCMVLALIQKLYPDFYFSHSITPVWLYVLMFSKFFIDAYAMVSMRCGFLDYKTAFSYLFIAPAILVNSIIIGFKSPQKIKKTNASQKQIIHPEKTTFDRHVVDAIITNGKKDLPCKLEITCTDEYSQVAFLFNNKRLTTSKQPRINYAIEELITKLRSHGFALKICANCGFFYLTEAAISNFDGEKGYCLQNNFKNGSKEKEYTCVWDGCFNIIPAQARNYILQQLGVENKK